MLPSKTYGTPAIFYYEVSEMAMLAGPLMGAKDSGKVRNWRMAKSRIVLIINVGRMLVLGLPQEQNGRPIGYITLLMLTCISPPNRLINVYHYYRWQSS